MSTPLSASMPAVQDNSLGACPESELHAIQHLQFVDLPEANRRLLALFQGAIPLKIVDASIIPRAVSLNSISGSLYADDGNKYFFKTHVEPDSILREYYNVELLESAGYPVVRPVCANHEPGRQIVVYPYLGTPTVFDLVREVEAALVPDQDLLSAQKISDCELFSIYERTLQDTPASGSGSSSPIHQLFHHRLAGSRFKEFYVGKSIMICGVELPFAELAGLRWSVNGTEYRESLRELIESAAETLRPDLSQGPTVIGHGDAHNGNLFYENSDSPLVYFDPAFAGRHSPLLDIAKPLFHNIFANWMYFPDEVAEGLQTTCRLVGDRVEVSHNYQISPFRRQMLQLKVAHVLAPMCRGPLGSVLAQFDWRRMLKAALLCCPLLTVNLANPARFPSEVALLGFTQCIEVGGQAVGERSFLDSLLDSLTSA
jgi:hypothetical protein